MVAFVNVKKLRDLFVKHTRVQRRKYEATLAAKKGIQELLRRQAALHNSRSALRDTAAAGLMDGADSIQRQYSQRRQQLDSEEVMLLSEQERLLDPISRSGGPLAAAAGHIQGATDQEAPSYNTNSGATTQRNSPVRTQSSPTRQRRAGQTSVLGMSDPILLNSLPLFAQHPASLCLHDREQRSAALLLFGLMKQVADDPTHRPFYSDIDLVNVLPSRLRPHTTSPDRLGRMPECSVNSLKCHIYFTGGLTITDNCFTSFTGTNQGNDDQQRSNAAPGSGAPSTKPPPADQEHEIEFTLSEQLTPAQYEIDDAAINLYTNLLVNFNPFQINDIIDAIDPRMPEAQYDDLLCQGLPDILHSPTLIDSVLQPHASDAAFSQSDATLRDILNRLFCICVTCRTGDPNDPRICELKHMWYNYATKIQSLYLRNLIREVPFQDQILYRDSYHNSAQRREMTYQEYAMAKHREKLQYYISDDVLLYGLIFGLNDVPPDYTCPIRVVDLISAPSSQVRSLQPLNPAGYVSNASARQRALPIGHMNRNLRVRSVKILSNDIVIPNPSGYPPIPPPDEESDSDSSNSGVEVLGNDLAPQRRSGAGHQGLDQDAEMEIAVFDYETGKPLQHQSSNLLQRFWDLDTNHIKHYAELGVVYINQKSRTHEVNIVFNRNQAEILKKLKLANYGLYPPNTERNAKEWAKLQPRDKRDHNFAKNSNVGLAIYDTFPWHLNQCFKYGCMEDVPAATSLREESVLYRCCVVNFHVIIHLTLHSELQVRAVTDAPICYIGKPVHPDMICSNHPDGCGKFLRPGDMVMVNAGQCIYYLATQFVSVRIVNAVGQCTCKVGYVKVLPDMVKLVGNRLAVVKSVHRRTGDKIVVQTLGNSVTQVMKPKKKKSLEDGKKSGKTAGKTLELCDCVNDYAMITFLDGGVPSFASRAFHTPSADSDGDDDDNKNDDGNESDDIQDTDGDQFGYDSDDSGDYDSDGNLKKIKAKPTKSSKKASSSTKSRKDDAKDQKKRKRMN
jgi:hypothetical protein